MFYKRDSSNKWKGPGKVIGQDGKVVFVRHGNIYITVSTCQLIKFGKEFQQSHVKVQLNETRNENSHIDNSSYNDHGDKTHTPNPNVN